MLALEFTFPAGRYHATPWDRHVNEGTVAWPPDPWRLLRALIATWHRKVKHTGRHQESTLLGLIQSLSEELPQFHLPSASHSHTRHYMPQQKAGDTSLVFDAFVAVARDEALQVIWPNIDLPQAQSALLDDLIAVIGYLGRAESWVEARRIMQPDEANCVQGDDAVDRETGEVRGDAVSLLAPLSLTSYRQQREYLLSDKRTAKKLAVTLPDDLLAALSVETSDLRKQGWNQPPAARKVLYLRQVDALRPRHRSQMPKSPPFTSVLYLLAGRPLPRVEDTVRIGEVMRKAVMKEFGDRKNGAIPSMISGHDLDKDNRHRHAFYLPYDANGDGRIDRVLLHVPAGLGDDERRVLEKVSSLWTSSGNEWRLVVEGIGGLDVGGPLLGKSREWNSITPYLHPWHLKKKFSVEEQIRRECRERGLPAVTKLDRLPSIRINGRERRPIHFHRFRSKRGLTQPDTHGSFWRIEFAEPVQGPLALGGSCHFGLGMFRQTDV